jgi:hypothetical protein
MDEEIISKAILEKAFSYNISLFSSKPLAFGDFFFETGHMG